MNYYCMLIEYDGSAFYGWQIQPDRLTVQQALQDALKVLCKEQIKVIAAGRTDTGVHATGQVAGFCFDGQLDLRKTIHSLNAITPRQVSILDMKAAPEGFDARRWATGREYRYYILNRPSPSALSRGRWWHLNGPLDLDAMEQGARTLLGEHDFTSFRGTGCGAKSPVRTMDVAKLNRLENGLTEWVFHGNGFLRHMIRNIIGTLHQVGEGKIGSEAISELLEAKDRTLAGPTAPPHGLYFTKVDYPKGVTSFDILPANTIDGIYKL